MDNLKGSVKVAIDAIRELGREGKVMIGGCAGPWGTHAGLDLEYTGDYAPHFPEGVDFEAELRAYHIPRMRCLIECGVNLIQFETQPRQDEAILLSKLLKEQKIKGWITFACNSEDTLGSGDRIIDTVKRLEWSEYLIGVGVNCTNIRFVTGCVKNCKMAMTELGLKVGLVDHGATNFWDKLGDQKQIVVYPNSGETYEAIGKTWIPDPLTEGTSFIQYARMWHQEGASMIGGCCRVNPDTIAELRTEFS